MVRRFEGWCLGRGYPDEEPRKTGGACGHLGLLAYTDVNALMPGPRSLSERPDL
jgi:hypothetical protein